MAYTPASDFLALLRTTSGGVRMEQMPGLDWAVSALSRMNLIQLWVGQTAPTVNQASTVWLKPAIPSWTAEGTVFLWNGAAFTVATPALWSTLIAGPFVSLIPSPSNSTPLVDAGAGAVGASLLYARQDHVHPTDTSRAPLASPALTGFPTAPTQPFNDNSQNIATTAFVQSSIGVPPPIGSVLPYAASTAPTNWVLCDGRAISRTTFANLFALIGIVFGSGDGVTTFNVPDLRGRVVAGVDGGVNRLTTTTMSSQTMAGVGGAETETLTLSQIPTGITSNGSASVNQPGDNIPVVGSAVVNNVGALSAGGSDFAAASSSWAGVSSLSGTNTATSNNTGGTAHVNVQPTMELQYIMRTS